MATSQHGNVTGSIPFGDFCSILEKISTTKGNDKKKGILRKFVDHWRVAHREIYGSADVAAASKESFFPAMRLLLPHLDKDRPAYGMKEVVLAKYYIEILGIAKESSDAQKLLNYRAPRIPKQESGDFASVAYFVLKSRCPEKGCLTLVEVNQYLDELAMSNTRKERGEMKKALQKMLRSTTSLEQKWLIRIVMRDLKMGLSETSVLAVFHPDAGDLFTVCSSLEKVCRDLHSLGTHLNEASIALNAPFRPMLGQRANIEQVMKLMDHQWFYVETKFDGDRMQMHKNGNKYMFFSRSSKDYTSSFGASSLEGPFTPKIHGAFNSDIHQCILDGEMVGWDPTVETYVSKGERVDVKTLGEEEGLQQCFVVFDVLMVNQVNLANSPLQDRAARLDKVFKPVPGYLHLVDRKMGSTKEDVIRALNEAIDRREEGLVVKMPSGAYKPDKRKGSGWVKIKPEYVDSLSDQVDVLIIGGYYGTGHRSGTVSHFLCGVATPPDNPRDKPTVFQSFCKVGTGYTMSELRTLNQQLMSHWRPYDPRRPPPSLAMATGGGSEKPSVWIEPCKSKIIQIRAAEIVSSDRYKTGCTLRFPRLEKFRDDKEWYQCMSTEELEQLRQMASGHLAHQHYDGEVDGEAPSSKRRKKAGAFRVEMPRGVAAQFRHTDTSDVQETGSMFKGKEFCVINGSRDWGKDRMERVIAEHGGGFVQHPGAATTYVVVASMVQRAKNILQGGKHDIVKIEWFEQCLVWKLLVDNIVIGNINVATVIISLVSCVFLIVVRNVNNCLSKTKLYKKLPIPIPSQLILVVVATLLSYLFQFQDRWSVSIVDTIERGPPKPSLPVLEHIPNVIQDSITVAIVSFAVGVSLSKVFAKRNKYEVSANQEMLAYGLCFVVGSFFSSFGPSGSLSRSLIQENVGGKTQLVGVFSSVIIFTVLVGIAPLFEPLPKTILASVVIVALYGMFKQVTHLMKYWKTSKFDMMVWLVIFTSTVLLGVDLGLLVGTLFSIALVVFRLLLPNANSLGQVKDAGSDQDSGAQLVSAAEKVEALPGILIFQFFSPLCYLNAGVFRAKLVLKSKIDPSVSEDQGTGCWMTAYNKIRGQKSEKVQEEDSDSLNRGDGNLAVNMHFDEEADTDVNHQNLPILSEDSEEREISRPTLKGIHTIIIDCAAISFVDAVGAETLQQVMNDYHEVNVQVLLVPVPAHVVTMLTKCGFMETFGYQWLFPSIQSAVEFASQGGRLDM